MNKRCCNCFSSSKIKSAKTNTPKITNMTETRFEMADMWSDIDRVESKMTPRLRAVEVGVIETFEGIARIGLDSLDSCRGRPIRRNSVLDWLRDNRLQDIQFETFEITSRSRSMLTSNLGDENDMELSVIGIEMMIDRRLRYL